MTPNGRRLRSRFAELLERADQRQDEGHSTTIESMAARLLQVLEFAEGISAAAERRRRALVERQFADERRRRG